MAAVEHAEFGVAFASGLAATVSGSAGGVDNFKRHDLHLLFTYGLTLLVLMSTEWCLCTS